MLTGAKENAEVLTSHLSSVFSQKKDYEPPGKCEVPVEGTGLQVEIDKQMNKE